MYNISIVHVQPIFGITPDRRIEADNYSILHRKRQATDYWEAEFYVVDDWLAVLMFPLAMRGERKHNVVFVFLVDPPATSASVRDVVENPVESFDARHESLVYSKWIHVFLLTSWPAMLSKLPEYTVGPRKSAKNPCKVLKIKTSKLVISPATRVS